MQLLLSGWAKVIVLHLTGGCKILRTASDRSCNVTTVKVAWYKWYRKTD